MRKILSTLIRTGLLLTFILRSLTFAQNGFKQFFTEADLRAIEKGKDVEHVFRADEYSGSFYTPKEIHAHPFDYLVVVKGKLKTTISQRKLANIFLAISKMKGIPYYSVTRDRWEELIMESYTVSDAEPHKTIPDHTRNQTGAFGFCFKQKDNRGGEILYKGVLDWKDNGTITYRTYNAQDISRYIIFRFRAGAIYRLIKIFPASDGYYFYVASRVKLPPFIPEKKTAKQSLANRAQAVIRFYRDRIREFKRP